MSTMIDLTKEKYHHSGKENKAPATAASDTAKATPNSATTTPIAATGSAIRKKPTTVTPPPSDRLLDAFIMGGDCYHMECVSSKEAKRDYWLTADDLYDVPVRQFGGGIGVSRPYKTYRHADLVETALATHGRTGLLKKLHARAKREANKTRREEQARQAMKEQKQQQQKAGQKSSPTPAASVAKSSVAAKSKAAASVADSVAPPPANPKEIAKLRANLLKMTKKAMGFEQSGAPSKWRIEIPMVTAATFAAVMNCPTDTLLKTFVKAGAYYKVQVDSTDVFDVIDQEDDGPSKLCHYFRRGGVSQKICGSVIVRFKPSQDVLSINGWANICD